MNNNYELYLGDCLDLLPSIPDNSVDLILCDLPYGTTQNKWDSCIDLLSLWKQYNRICNGPVVLFAQTPFDKVLGCSNIKNLRYEWIWEKTAATGFLNAKKAPMKAHENILVFYKKYSCYNPQKTSGHSPTHSYTKRNGDGTNYGKTAEISGGGSTQRYPRSVLLYPSDKQKLRLHPTQKPLALVEYLIKTYSNIGDTVLDNCIGSGTTGVGCVNLNRKFIGMELDEGYFNIAKERIETTHAIFPNPT